MIDDELCPPAAAGRERVVALVERVAFLEARVAALHAEQVSVLSDLAVDRFVDEHDVDLVVELGARCRWTSYTADRRLATAMRLAACFPLLLADLGGGELDLHRVQVVVAEAELLDEEQALVLDAVLAGSLAGLTTAQVKALVRAQVAVIDSDAVRERARRVLARRRVEFAALEDGAASLQLVGPAEAVRGVYDRLDALARDTTRPGAGLDPYAGVSTPDPSDSPAGRGAAGGESPAGAVAGAATSAGPGSDGAAEDRRGIDAKRFDAGVELLRAPVVGAPGVAAGTGPQIHLALSSAIGLDDLPAHLSGFGPIPAERVRHLLTHTGFRRVITDPLTGHLVTVDGHTYRPGTLPDLGAPGDSMLGGAGDSLTAHETPPPAAAGAPAATRSAPEAATSATPSPPVARSTSHRADAPATSPIATDEEPALDGGLATGVAPTIEVRPSTVGELATDGDLPDDGDLAVDEPLAAEVASTTVAGPTTDEKPTTGGILTTGEVLSTEEALLADQELVDGDGSCGTRRRVDAAPFEVPTAVEPDGPGPGWDEEENGFDRGYDPATDDPAHADPTEGPRESEFTVTLDITAARPATLTNPHLVKDPTTWVRTAHRRARTALSTCPTVRAGDRAYRFPTALRRFLTQRSPHCTAPGCRAPAHRCDLDHTTDHTLGGPTCPCNTTPLCRRHHRAKHTRGWTPTRTTTDPSDPTTTWITPLGYLYTVPTTPLLPTTTTSTAALVHAHLHHRRRARAAHDAEIATRPSTAGIHTAYAALTATRRDDEDATGAQGPLRHRVHTTDHHWEDGCHDCEPEPTISLRGRPATTEAETQPARAPRPGVGEPPF